MKKGGGEGRGRREEGDGRREAYIFIVEGGDIIFRLRILKRL